MSAIDTGLVPEGYDVLTARGVLDLLPTLDAAALRAVRAHEEHHKARVTILRQLDELHPDEPVGVLAALVPNPTRRASEPPRPRFFDREMRVVAGAVAGFVALVLIVGVVARGGGDDASSSEPVVNTTRVTLSVHEACMQDTLDWMNQFVAASNSGDSRFVYRRYGGLDPRTSQLVQMNGRFQADIMEFGETRANVLLTDQLDAYCTKFSDEIT